MMLHYTGWMITISFSFRIIVFCCTFEEFFVVAKYWVFFRSAKNHKSIIFRFKFDIASVLRGLYHGGADENDDIASHDDGENLLFDSAEFNGSK